MEVETGGSPQVRRLKAELTYAGEIDDAMIHEWAYECSENDSSTETTSSSSFTRPHHECVSHPQPISDMQAEGGHQEPEPSTRNRKVDGNSAESDADARSASTSLEAMDEARQMSAGPGKCPVLPFDIRLTNIGDSSSHTNIIICNPRVTDCPIVFASLGFTRLTGYGLDECLGRSCVCLQGKGTNPASVKQISAACRAGTEVQLTLLNYKKDGTPFWNSLRVSPMRDKFGTLMYILSTHTDVST